MAAIAATVGSKGLGILLTLGKLVGAMYLGLAIFVVVVVGGALLIARCRSARSCARCASRC